MNKDDVYEAKRKINKINSSNDKPMIPITPVKERQNFDEKYKRVTTYIEKPLYQIMERLYKAQKIQRKTEFINAAIKEYIGNHYRF